MAINIAALEKQREMIDSIIKLASDPEAAQLLEKLFTQQNGGATVEEEKPIHRPAMAGATTPDSHPKKPLTLFNESDSELPAARGKQVAAIRKAVMRHEGHFTVGDIGDSLRGAGMDINNVAIGKVLKRFAAKSKEIVIVERGEGSNPNIYQRTENAR